MVIHNVMWILKDGVDKDEAYRELKPLLEGLAHTIHEVEFLELGRAFNSGDVAWDLILRSRHADKAGLEAYRVHPDHVKVAKRVRELIQDSAVVDYTV